MGWSGILGAMTQGLGTGIVKNVEQGWKDEETQKLLDWKTAEADKQRAFDSELLDKKYKHEFELEDHRTRNEISAAAAKARISARYSHSGESEAQKNLLGVTQALGIYDNQLNALDKKLSETEDKEQRNEIATRIKTIHAERNNFLKHPDTIAKLKKAGPIGDAIYATANGDMDFYHSKPVERKTVAEDVKSSVAPPVRNMIDVNNLTPQQAADIARQKSEDAARLQFSKASADAKDWAQKRTQYQSSTFIPRTF
ncbi:TPA: hypothetical protein ACPKB6_000071 [Haemophilus influenzae]|uniref:hypothetical protein n=1 Tax=Haemophilus influenzae TaxID=727 RepID=UPI00313B8986